MSKRTGEQNLAVSRVNAELQRAGLPRYTELVGALEETFVALGRYGNNTSEGSERATWLRARRVLLDTGDL